MVSFVTGEAARSLWQERLVQFEASGLSVKEFCAAEGYSVGSLYQWRKRLRSGKTEGTLIAQPAFQPVQVVGAATGLSMEFPGIGTLTVPASQLDVIRAVVGELASASRRSE